MNTFTDTDVTVTYPHTRPGGPAELPEINAVLLYDLIRWAEFEDEHLSDPRYTNWGVWDQSSWAVTDAPDLTDEERQELRNGSCQTSYCIAGQAVHQTNHRIIFGSGRSTAEYCIKQEPTGRLTRKGLPIMRDVPGVDRRMISDVGRDAIGLTEDEADALFSGANEVHNLKRYANTFMLARALPPLFTDEGHEDVARGSCWDYYTTEDVDNFDY